MALQGPHFIARTVCYISFRFSSLCGVPGPELAMSQLLLSSLRRRRSPRSRIASRILKLTSSSPSLAESWLRGFSCWPDVPGNPPNELLRLLLRLRFRLGGRVEKKPKFARLWNDSFRGSGSWEAEPSSKFVVLALLISTLGGCSLSRVEACRLSSRKGSVTTLAASKSGNNSGPSVLILSVTCLASAARRKRSLTNVLADDGLSDNNNGRKDLTISMPISPIRSAANVIVGNRTMPIGINVHSGTDSGT